MDRLYHVNRLEDTTLLYGNSPHIEIQFQNEIQIQCNYNPYPNI